MKLFEAVKRSVMKAKVAFFAFPLKIRIVLVLGILAIIGFYSFKAVTSTSGKPQYQTEKAVKGTLVTTVTASGTISAGGTVNITTGVSGTVTAIYVKSGDTVAVGQKIADVALDRDSLQKQTQAWASYLSAQNSLNNAQTALYTLQSSMFTKWKTYTDKAVNSTYQNADGSPKTDTRNLVDFTTSQDDWLAAEANYKNQQNAIAQAQASLTSAWYNYQLLSSTITAPAAGSISNLTIAEGLPITISSTSNNNSSSVTTQAVGTITLGQGSVQALVSLSEVDAPKVAPGNKVTLTLTAFPGKTYTGKVLIVNTNGAVSSGVTTYPAVIAFDTTEKTMYPNMAVDANIITSVKDDVILVPTAAVQTQNGASTVRTLVNGKLTNVDVVPGGANDTETEIISGINEGDTVVTSVTNTSRATQTSTGTSPFSAFGGRGGFGGGGGGAVRVTGR
jgi:multidrug efflux pump subunit AcrA (membrane-fusion protein)